MRILVVEDFCAIARGLSEVLREQGHQVDCVTGFSDLDKLQAVDLDDKPVTLHARDGLRDRRPGMAEVLGEPCAHGRDAVLDQLVDGP